MTFSMTGFARAEANLPSGTLSVEVKSVNHRYLEVFVRLPDVLRFAEAQLRERVRQEISRGKLEVTVRWQREDTEQSGFHVQTEVLMQLHAALSTVRTNLPEVAMPNALELLQWPGVIAEPRITSESLNQTLEQALNDALVALRAHRAREGTELSSQISQRLDQIQVIVQTLRAAYPDLQRHIAERLRERIARFQVDVDPERFEQEVVMLLQKADVAEELDRLDVHIAETRKILQRKEPIGRRLDFLMQEFNREANTLGSKATATDYSQAAIDLKVLIEQMREQIQNIE
ncbi:YicC/YloC family endoribonuclease [Salinispirillum marinum]|uniref:YicC/YloC family endoribonuclease n=2 Tax=Saccharospirillaceae TaxID=255527 RepID=A0ABV8BDV7_9GAMM